MNPLILSEWPTSQTEWQLIFFQCTVDLAVSEKSCKRHAKDKEPFLSPLPQAWNNIGNIQGKGYAGLGLWSINAVGLESEFRLKKHFHYMILISKQFINCLIINKIVTTIVHMCFVDDFKPNSNYCNNHLQMIINSLLMSIHLWIMRNKLII